MLIIGFFNSVLQNGGMTCNVNQNDHGGQMVKVFLSLILGSSLDPMVLDNDRPVSNVPFLGKVLEYRLWLLNSRGSWMRWII